MKRSCRRGVFETVRKTECDRSAYTGFIFAEIGTLNLANMKQECRPRRLVQKCYSMSDDSVARWRSCVM
jgi:hypothetical protein